MGKIDEYSFKGQKQELIDFKDQVTDTINFGKVATTVVSIVPNWVANVGEEVYFISGNTGRLYTNTSSGVSSWKIVATFTP